ncbi:MAG: hypothetical protein V3V08_23560 [Nannocystaceae bacterium]
MTAQGWFLKESVWLPPQLTLLDPSIPFHIKRMLDTAARTAPEVVGGRICCTAIGREVDPEKFSYHGVGRAVDLRTGLSGTNIEDLALQYRDGAITKTESVAFKKDAYWEAMEWASRLRAALGDGYDVIYGIEQSHTDHVHIERDKRDG